MGMTQALPDFPQVDFGTGQFPGDALHSDLRAMREAGAVVTARFMGMPAHVITRHAPLVTAFRDAEGFPPELIYKMMFEPVSGPTFQTMTGRDHLVRRRLATVGFRATAVKQYDETTILELTDELLDALEREGERDFADAFTRRLPFLVITRLLGIPRDAEDRFHAWATALLRFAEDGKRARAANEELTAYLRPLVAARRAAPTSDILSDLIRAEVDGERFTDEEVISHVRLLFSAGASTTHDALGNLIYHLLSDRDRYERCKSDHDAQVAAVEELLRYDSPVAVLPRLAGPKPVELAGSVVPPGLFVMFAISAANRDPAVFERPDEFLIDRDERPLLTTFGPGHRSCPGAHLARRQLALVLGRVLDRLPSLRLLDEPAGRPVGAVLRGPVTLPVSL
jgi:cytochrome P450